jgi:hypothetical protein
VRGRWLELHYIPFKPCETFWRQLNHDEIEASEVSLSYTILRSQGDERLVFATTTPPPCQAEVSTKFGGRLVSVTNRLLGVLFTLIADLLGDDAGDRQ